MSLPITPPINLSYSAVQTANQCARRAALSGPGAWQAWPNGLRANDIIAALCYRAKHLQDLPAAFGQSLHAVLEKAVKQVARTGRCPDYAWVYDQAMKPLRMLWQRRRDEFERNPKLGYLRKPYFGEKIDIVETEQVKRRAQIAVSAALEAPLLENLRELDRKDPLLTEELLSMPFVAESFPHASLFGKADVVYIERNTLVTDQGIFAPGEGGIPIIVDFKTGRVRMQEFSLQLAILALLLEANGIPPHPVAGYVGRLIDLSEQAVERERWVLVSRADMDGARAWLGRGLETLTAMSRDDEGFVELHEVPKTVGPHCLSCAMRRACVAVDEQTMAAAQAA